LTITTLPGHVCPSGKCRIEGRFGCVMNGGMAEARPVAEHDLRKSVLFGLAAGLAYTLIDGYLDHTFGVPVSAPVRPIEIVHAIVDFVLPAITGALFGISVHYLRLRARMVELEKQRADGLIGDLHKIERDQAVWVISASLLHELKNPLHALGLLLDEALDVDAGDLELQRQLLLRARSQVERIASELATLRALPHSTRPELPELNVDDVTRAALATMAERAPFVEIDYDVKLKRQPVVRANPAYVRIILENLLENAVDALSASEHVGARRVDVTLGGDAERCTIDVADSGPGVDVEARAHLFEPLNTTKDSGMGLGLSIARTLARAMGGDLEWVEQAGGARFRLSLPWGNPAP
jgi:signal transduction histidine kinase